MPPGNTATLPTLHDLGPDILRVPAWRRTLELVAPFGLCSGFFVAASREHYVVALLCPVLISFLTYGSISHDLVHRNLALPRWLNEWLLCLTELMTFRSGHAYRCSHLYHHAHFPAPDDLEGRAAGMRWWRALLEGVTLQPRLWRFAMRHCTRDRRWIIGEGAAVLITLALCLALLPLTPLPAAFALLVIAGSWIFPFMTAFIPHDPRGENELTQTRLFRGIVLRIVALQHLYHLEHHLYPQVPHQNWPKLARRIDPDFERLHLRAIRLLF
jgi:beta-carotene hydroxylase